MWAWIPCTHALLLPPSIRKLLNFIFHAIFCTDLRVCSLRQACDSVSAQAPIVPGSPASPPVQETPASPAVTDSPPPWTQPPAPAPTANPNAPQTPPGPTSNKSSSSGGVSLPIIIGAACGVAALLIVLGMVVFCMCRNKRKPPGDFLAPPPAVRPPPISHFTSLF